MAAPNVRCHRAVLLAGALRRPDWPVAAQPHLYSVIDDLSGFGLGQSAPAVGGPGQRFGDHDQQQLVDCQAHVGDVQRAAFCLLADGPAQRALEGGPGLLPFIEQPGVAILFGDHQSAQGGDIFLEHHRHPLAAELEDVFYQCDYRGMAAVYTADAKLFAESAPVVEGRPAIEEFWKQGCEQGRLARMKRSIQIHEARASSDLGYSQSTVTLEIDGQPAKILIRGVCVWRREPDGIWRITHDISNRGEQRYPGEQPYGVAIGQP